MVLKKGDRFVPTKLRERFVGKAKPYKVHERESISDVLEEAWDFAIKKGFKRKH